MEIAELSAILGDVKELSEAVMVIRRYLSVGKFESKLALVSNLIQTCLENGCYESGLGLSQQKLLLRPGPEGEFKVGLCLYQLRRWEDCISTLKGIANKLPNGSSTLLYARSCRLLSESYHSLGKAEESKSYSEM